DTIAVDVYFHIASSTAKANIITDQIIQAQFQVLHGGFLPYGIELSLVSTGRIVDNIIATGYWVNGSIEDFDAYLAYLTRTRRGGYDALNIYYYTDMERGISGFCNLPTIVIEGDQFFYRDGCQVNGNSMPGVPDPLENSGLGHTSVHESGHWFGLLHTFQGGCSISGDGVDDTPPQASASTGCPEGRDSCPGLAGLDPIHNYMDYSSDTW
ncbi:metalloprotease MEP1, partial [Zopfia rhizophila CBS 207.26]